MRAFPPHAATLILSLLAPSGHNAHASHTASRSRALAEISKGVKKKLKSAATKKKVAKGGKKKAPTKKK